MLIVLCIGKIAPVPCLHEDFILVGINSEEKWFLSRGGACDGSMIGGVCCWGSCHVERLCLSICLFDCRSVDPRLGRG